MPLLREVPDDPVARLVRHPFLLGEMGAGKSIIIK